MTTAKTKYEKLFAAYEEYTRAIARNFSDFLEQDEALLAAIVARSKFRNAKEYYLVRHRIDALEGDAGAGSERDLRYALVDRFES